MPHIGARWRSGSNRRHLVRGVIGPPPPHGKADAGWRVRIMAPGWGPEVSWPIPHGKNGVHRIPSAPFGLGELVQLGEWGRSVSRWGRSLRSRFDRAGAFRPVGDVKHSPSSGAVCSPTGWGRHHPIQLPRHMMTRRLGLSVTKAGPARHDLARLSRRVHVPGPLLNKYSRNPPMTASEFHLPLIDSQQESPT